MEGPGVPLPPSLPAPPAAAVAHGGEALKADCIAMVAFDSRENTPSISPFHFWGFLPAEDSFLPSLPVPPTSLQQLLLYGVAYFFFFSFFFFCVCLSFVLLVDRCEGLIGSRS